MAEKHIRLAKKIALSRLRRFPNLYPYADDIFQGAYEGLLTAVVKFDPSRGFQFSTYAMYWIEERIRRTERDVTAPVHVPSAKGNPPHLTYGEMPVLVSEAPGDTIADRLSLPLAKEVRRRLTRAVRKAHAERYNKRTINADQAVDAFLRTKIYASVSRGDNEDAAPTVARELGCSRERVRQIGVEVSPFFQAIVKEYREEAA